MSDLIATIRAYDPKWRSNPFLSWRGVEVHLYGEVRPKGVYGAYMRFHHTGLEYALKPEYRSVGTAIGAAKNALRATFKYQLPG